MESIVFHKFRDRWVFTSEGQTPSGISLAIEPVRKVAHDDAKTLQETFIQLLSEKPATIPEPDYDDPEFKQTIFAKAFGLKTYSQYLKEARCFYIRVVPVKIVLEEWPRSRGGFLADHPMWKKAFAPDDFDGAVAFLIHKTRGN